MSRSRFRRAVAVAAGALLAAALPAAAYAQSDPPPLPGAPPGVGGAPPQAASGSAPSGGTPAPAAMTPSLAGRTVTAAHGGRRIALGIVCRMHGTVTVRAARLSRRPLAAERYRCRRGQATVHMRLSRRAAARLARHGSVRARAILREAGRVKRQRFTIAVGARAHSSAGQWWTSGVLQCTPTGTGQGIARLISPDWKYDRARIWIRGYVWIKNRGIPNGEWFVPRSDNPWYGPYDTDLALGVLQWNQALPGTTNTSYNPWSWDITMPWNQDTYAIGAFEVGWYDGSQWQTDWNFVSPSSVGVDRTGTYCYYF